MIGLEFLIIGGVIGLSIFLVQWQRKRWANALNQLLLSVNSSARSELSIEDASSLFKSPSLVGTVEGVDIKLDTFTRGSGRSKTTYTRVANQEISIHPSISIREEHIGDAFLSIFRGDDVQIGAQDFDAAMHLDGDRLLLLSLLHQEARAVLHVTTPQGASIENGAAKVVESGQIIDPHRLETMVYRVVALTKALREDDLTIPQRLCRNALEEDRSSEGLAFRRQCMMALAKHYAEGPEVANASTVLVNDPDPQLRLIAAQNLGSKGLPILKALLSDATIPPKIRQEALSGLEAQGFDLLELRDMIFDVLQNESVPLTSLVCASLKLLMKMNAEVPLALITRFVNLSLFTGVGEADSEKTNEQLRSILIALLSGREQPDALPPLRQLFDSSDAVCVKAGTAFGQLADESHIPELLEALNGESDQVAVAATVALGFIGGAENVPEINERASGFLTKGLLKAVAEDAVEKILNRVGHRRTGGLSLARERSEGGLAIASSNTKESETR